MYIFSLQTQACFNSTSAMAWISRKNKNCFWIYCKPNLGGRNVFVFVVDVHCIQDSQQPRTSGAFHTKCMMPARNKLLTALKDSERKRGTTWHNTCVMSGVERPLKEFSFKSWKLKEDPDKTSLSFPGIIFDFYDCERYCRLLLFNPEVHLDPGNFH